MLSESEKNELFQNIQDDTAASTVTSVSSNHHLGSSYQQSYTTSAARSIPVPQQNQSQQPQSQASSQGSSGSAFLSSVLNPQLLSHTPPSAFGTSDETKHLGKRARSGSVSGRLRSASEYLEEKGLLDRQTVGMLKDLIIIGDEELQNALDAYSTKQLEIHRCWNT
jgi:hypothetical protein